MHLDPLHGFHPSCEARCIFAYLHRRGGSVRLGPLLRGLGMDQRTLLDAVWELSERYWITIVWRKAAAPDGPLAQGAAKTRNVGGEGSDPALAAGDQVDEHSRALTDIYRLCTTRFGRRKYRASWPVD